MNKSNTIFLKLTTFIVGICSILYELLISTSSSYFLGNSVLQFSIIIGFYLASMGVGSYMSRWIQSNKYDAFILIEIILGLVGAFSVPLIYIYFAYADYTGFQFFVLLIISIIGILTGLEVPLLTHLLENENKENENLSDVLTYDYLGALIATLAFPFLLIPFMGLYKSSLLVGTINIVVAALVLLKFKDRLKTKFMTSHVVKIVFLIIFVLMSGMFLLAHQFLNRWNNVIFKHPVVYHTESKYQDIVVTQNRNEMRLYLNGAIQFSSRDEYRYHEALAHPAMQSLHSRKNILVLGGGEGLLVRELLKYNELVTIDLVDLDEKIVDMAKTFEPLVELNNHAFEDPRVTVHIDDAFKFLKSDSTYYDLIICDLPDPTTESLARLYSNAFYHLAGSRLRNNGIFVTQATSPDLTPKAFWCIDQTLKDSGFLYTYPYHINVPSFGEWGFIMASRQPISLRIGNEIPLRFLSEDMLPAMQFFSIDIRQQGILPNYLDQPILLEYYLEHYRQLSNEQR
ncbi:MAG TPA: polyamine aminopropyltransferase [Saprospiraceae bacterium]|nr:polyamine aminopropyltransferase [Saprospiraceae bacterium]MCB9328732.1 polyamine aminopropyltransferase [Lewinellaceae bacterium]HPQ21830.1 polyamine aminopropyltransferase [Saprospiraceae bacterium]